MRARTAWLIIFGVNVLWAAAFVGYARRSAIPVVRGGEILHRPPPTASVTPPLSSQRLTTNELSPGLPANTMAGSSISIATNTSFVPAGREFTWKDVTNDLYTNYVIRLRLTGCPEAQVRKIVVSDVSELYDKKRLERSVRLDAPWWKAEGYLAGVAFNVINGGSNQFDDDRRQLLDKLLGEGWEQSVKLTPVITDIVPLSGAVLGALPVETWNNVQEVCQRSMDKHRHFLEQHLSDAAALQDDSPDMAKLRDYTRTELTKILSPEQMEEFLLRYSLNAKRLREEMQGLDLAADEFRKIFRAIDPLEHQMQLDYGDLAALSQKQREQFEAQKDRAVREAVSPEKFQVYQLTKDPLYRQAQQVATAYGMSSKAVQPIYELQKSTEARKMEISKNTGMTPEQKTQALQSVAVEQQQNLQRMITDRALR